MRFGRAGWIFSNMGKQFFHMLFLVGISDLLIFNITNIEVFYFLYRGRLLLIYTVLMYCTHYLSLMFFNFLFGHFPRILMWIYLMSYFYVKCPLVTQIRDPLVECVG